MQGAVMKIMPQKSFYFVRHGQTDANAQGLMCGGGWDVSLNEIGKGQASQLAEQVASLSPQIEHIFISPMLRTQQTAEALNALLKAPMTTIEGLREWCVGDWEKMPWDETPNPFTTKENPTNGETLEQFDDRIIETMKSIFDKDKESFLIVSHGAFAHRLFSFLGLEGFLVENCTIYHVESQRSHWVLNKLV